MDDLFPTDRLLDVQIFISQGNWNTIRHQGWNFRTALDESRQHGPIESPYTYVPARVVIDGVVYPEVGARKKGFIGSQSSSPPVAQNQAE